jgi:pimeloyl-ACP methyl ester carboxylesterase
MAVKKIVTHINNRSNEFNISYDIVNPKNEETIVFLHGWGSNKNIMKQAFSSYCKNKKHIYIDMPGFGNSSNEIELHTKDYALIMKEFFNSLNINPDIIAGHSFGGKVATLLKPELLVLLSTAGIIQEKSAKVKLKIKMAKIFNMLGLSNITKSFRSDDVNNMSENMYKTFKNVVDEDFSEIFENYDKKTKIFWGKDDTATSLQSGQTINRLIKDSEFKAYDGDHYFFLKHSKDITACIC